MKTGVATLHYGFNEGAVLQAYGVTRLIDSVIGGETEILDQRYPEKVNLYGAPANARELALSEAIDSWLPLSPKQFLSAGSNTALDYAAGRYAAYFVGSDQVWNLLYKGRLRRFIHKGIFPRQPGGFFTPFPNVYWPGPELELPKFSYAASVGRFDWSQVPGRDKRAMVRVLSEFSLLSVRDERSRQFIEWLDPGLAQDVVIVPDPTLSIDIIQPGIKQGLKQRLVEYGVDFDRPRIGIVSADSAPVGEFADKMRDKHCQIIGITTKNSFSDIALYDKGFHPLEWASLFSFMDVCVVERMHAAIFCLRNHAPFVLIDINGNTQDRDTKSKHLMRLFGLDEFCVAQDSVSAAQLLKLSNELMSNRSYLEGSSGTIEAMQGRAVEFVRSAGKLISCGH